MITLKILSVVLHIDKGNKRFNFHFLDKLIKEIKGLIFIFWKCENKNFKIYLHPRMFFSHISLKSSFISYDY